MLYGMSLLVTSVQLCVYTMNIWNITFEKQCIGTCQHVPMEHHALLKVTFDKQFINPQSTGRRFGYAHGDLGFSLKLFKIATEVKTATRFGDLTLPLRFYYASVTLLL